MRIALLAGLWWLCMAVVACGGHSQSTPQPRPSQRGVDSASVQAACSTGIHAIVAHGSSAGIYSGGTDYYIVGCGDGSVKQVPAQR